MQLVDIAMNFDQIAAAGLAMEAVHVLSEHADVIEMGLQVGDNLMRLVERSRPAGLFDLVDVFPGDVRSGFQGFTGQGVLDGMFSSVIPLL